MPVAPSRGDVWQVDLEPVRGHEQGRVRPAVVVSTDQFNHGPAGLVIVVPVTSTNRRNPLHVQVEPPEGGLARTSFVMCEMARCVSIERLSHRRGVVSPATMAAVGDRLRIVLDL